MARIFRSLSQFTKKDIDQIFKRASAAFKNELITILVAPRQKAFARILIITPRTVGSAPERNKLRRQFKAIFYEQKLYEGSADHVVILKKGAQELSFDTYKNLLISAKKK